ncbi:MAG: aminotransferase class I/II-fold pyridoxal phosphate-dependent enzyme, partial [Oscillospiraceae bacterium]
MAYDFETLSPARDACPHVWDYIRSRGITDPEAISYAVAEMKFPLAPAIKAALHDCAETGYFGYGRRTDYSDTVCAFMRRRHGWQAEPDWLTQTYGVVTAIGIAIRALTAPGDGVIIQTPVYDPFGHQVLANGRVLVENPLRRAADRYEMDFADLEEKSSRPDVKMLVLCSPHNPVGRVWTR